MFNFQFLIGYISGVFLGIAIGILIYKRLNNKLIIKYQNYMIAAEKHIGLLENCLQVTNNILKKTEKAPTPEQRFFDKLEDNNANT